MGTARHARRALIAAAAALLCFVAVFAAAGNSVRAVVSGAFTKSEEIRAAQASLAQAVTLQLDEETGVRGSLATGQVSFLEPYHLGRTQLPVALAALQERVGVLGLPEASRHARTLAALNREWTAAVARPLLTLPPSNGLREQRRGKTLVDRFRAEAASLDAILNRRRIAVNDAMQAAIWRVGTYVLVSVLVIAGLALGLVALQLRFLDRLERERARADEERLRASRMQAAYETEKRIADKLQGALFQRPLPATSGLELSATYAPAEEETRVGGDWYDVLELPGDRIFFAIGDVAGHGIDAAVAMNRARHALVSAAMRAGESRGVLTHANEELCRDGTVMVTAIAGFANYRNVNSIWRSPVIPHRCFSSPADRRGCSRAAVCRWVFRAPIRTRRSTFKPYRDRRWFSIP
ncbi:MAG TPA: CHASE3 domain-containing protein, partial [Candidatus Tumulicola sp.]|nr:CHASE3 domain-containing protein [Candidatus Tumulicola sp.]